MTDEKFTFGEDVKEKKIASRSARNRIAHTGKVVYIRPYTKCKGRGTKIIHEYITGGNTDE